MGGFAVIIDWDKPVEANSIDPMLELIPHRATGGARVHRSEHAVLAETRTTGETAGDGWEIARLGPLTLVGAIRLIRRNDLRNIAGRRSATAHLSDRELILTAYERKGLAFLDAIDGDYAFVIWNDTDRTAVAVRDRFAVKPIFFESTRTGVRFASEINQLATTSRTPPEPNPGMVAEYLLGTFRETRHTFFAGIDRIRPSDAMMFSAAETVRHRYWSPAPDLDRSLSSQDIPHRFREHLAESVKQRLADVPRAAAQMSGGLDSTSIVASAQIAGIAPERLDTISMVFPGYEADESRWIEELAAIQPYTNHTFAPPFGTIDEFVSDMEAVGSPRIDPIHQGSHSSATIANQLDASILLTGFGGDYVLDESHVPVDVLRSGHLARWLTQTRQRAGWIGERPVHVAARNLRTATPSAPKNAYRRVRPIRNDRIGLLAQPLQVVAAAASPVTEPMNTGLATRTATILAGEARQPMLTLTLELVEAAFARHGIGLSEPFLDRQLYDFVLSIPPLAYPYDGSSKPIARKAFADVLPPSVTGRRTGTVFTDYTVAIYKARAAEFISRFPEVPEFAAAFVSRAWYREACTTVLNDLPSPGDLNSLWTAWTLMLWLEHIHG
ncbi:MAG: lasso peptide isopeptide bond-forming cyclase [Acidimicrobiia bacterium]|nr:MAG: lasso peptide isopeptide bond-forming cyclase [Acidimicrobiia bacterium]